MAGERAARLGGDGSRPDRTQEHRPADPRLFTASRRARAGETGGTRDARSAHAAEEAVRARAARRRVRGAAHRDRGRRVVVPQCEPARKRRHEGPAEAARLSIVVLPFANLSGDPGQDYLVDALTDELTTSLARIRNTFVIARNTAMTFKGKPIDAKAIGKDLGVRYVLEGSVQPSGDRMRVNAQLIDAGSGAHLWAEHSTRPAPICCKRRTRSSRIWRNTLDFQLTEAEAARLKRTPAANPDAEDLALQCGAGVWKAVGIGKEADAASF